MSTRVGGAGAALSPPMSVGSLRFGVQCAPEGATVAELIAFWRQVEALGYDWISLPDHLRPARLAPTAPCFETTALLAALAATTTRVRIGTLTLGNGLRSPAVLAKVLATIDHVSGGRLEPGIGAGWDAREHAAYGLPFPSPGVRARRLAEAIEILRLLWSGERVSFPGRHYVLRDAISLPRPLQRPAPPLWIGGTGERVLLRVVARHADGWNTSLLAPEEYAVKARALARHCDDLDRDPATIRRSLVATVICAPDDHQAERMLARLEAHWNGPVHRAQNLVGGARACAERLARYLPLGVRDFVVRAHVRPLGAELVTAFMHEVVPLLRQSLPEMASSSGAARAASVRPIC